MQRSLGSALIENFLGHSPDWYKITIVAFLIINPIVAVLFVNFIAGW